MNEYFRIGHYWDSDPYALQRIYKVIDNDIFNEGSEYFFSGIGYFNINYLDIYNNLTLNGKELIRRLSIIPGILNFHIYKTLPSELRTSQYIENSSDSIYIVINRYPHFRWGDINVNINYLIRDNDMLSFRHTLTYQNRNNIERNNCFYKRNRDDMITFYTYKNLLKSFLHSVHWIKYQNNGLLQFNNFEPDIYIHRNEYFLTRRVSSFFKYILTNYITHDMFGNVSCFRHSIKFQYSRRLNEDLMNDIFDFVCRSLIHKFHFYQITELPSVAL